MRQPTPIAGTLAWHRAALAGENPPIHDSEPEAGFFQMRLVRGGPWVPVRIWLHQVIDGETGELVQDERLAATVDGRPADPCQIWTRCAAHPVSEQYFAYLTAGSRWDRAHAPHHPAANPTQPTDHLKTPLPY